MSKILFSGLFFVAALLASASVTAYGADKKCFELKAECLEYTRESAERGIAAAQYNLGLMYYKGEGVAANKREAARWLWLAAEQGDAVSQYFLGVIYQNGDGVAVDKPEAMRWYRAAAEQKYADAQYNLGWMYQNGDGITTNKRKAARWYRLAAEQGDATAQLNLGWMYGEGDGIAMDKREAVRWYRLAAEQGDSTAQFNLGLMYRKGEGVAVDHREAVRWYRAAAEQGDADAQFKLGLMYRKGEGVAVDYREAVRWYRAAAEQGDADAQNNLGFMYHTGKGVATDKREALRWYHMAAEHGFMEAQAKLGVLYLIGEGVAKDQSEAYIWFLIANASGSENAAKMLLNPYWQKHLNSAGIQSAKIEAARRFDAIQNRKNSVQSSDNNLAKTKQRGFTIAKPPEQTDVAAEVFENTWRSVVMIKNNTGQGGGVIIRPNMVATNCHVIEGGGVAVYKPENGKINENVPFSAEVIHRNEKHDFCILEVKGLWGVAAAIRKYDTLKVGENVYALGAPRGLDLSLSNGLISQLRTDGGTRFIQTDAAISPGSSGGGLFDKQSNFIGILTGKYTDENTEGIGFAIPADLVLKF